MIFPDVGQMLLINQRMDKLAAARNDFEDRGMLHGSLFSAVAEAFDSLQSGDHKDDDDATESSISDMQQAGFDEEDGEELDEEGVSNTVEEGPQDVDSTAHNEGHWSIVDRPHVEASVKLAQRNGAPVISFEPF